MKTDCKLLMLLISLAFCFSLSAAFADSATDIPAEIVPDKIIFSDSIYTISVKLHGEAKPGDRLIAECYSKGGDLKESKELDPVSDVKIEFSDAVPSDFSKILWTDANRNQRCEPINVRFNVIYVPDWMDLAEATSFMTNEYAGKVQVISGNSLFSSGRLIAKADSELPDLSDYHFEFIIIDEENHYFIQFLSDKDAIDCAEYLTTLENVVYVEPDSVVYATDDIGQDGI